MDDFTGFGDWDGGISPGQDYSNMGNFDWGSIDFGGSTSGPVDLGSLENFGFDLTGIQTPSFGNIGDLYGFGADVGIDKAMDPYEVDQQTTRTETDALKGRSNYQSIVDNLKKLFQDKNNLSRMTALLGGVAALKSGRGRVQPRGYTGGIPKYTAQRIPGRGVVYTRAAEGGLMSLAKGGKAPHYLRGNTDGMADKIQTDIDGKQPARLSHGEFVVPADVVSHLGNGNSDAGAKVLYEMMAKVRKARTGNQRQGKEINPRKYIPA